MSPRVIHAHYREARRIQPGWQVRCEGEWLTVQTVLSGKHVPTNTPIVVLRFANGDASRCENFREVLCRNKAEVSRAGEGR